MHIPMYEIAVYVSLVREGSLTPRVLHPLEQAFQIPLTLDSYSEAALEYALRLSDQAKLFGKEARITAVAISDDIPDLILQNLFACGIHQIFLLVPPQDMTFTPQAAAGLLSQFLSRYNWNVILTGQQDSASCDMTMGVYLARILRLPYLGPLSDLALTADGFEATRSLPDGAALLSVPGPCVCAFSNTEHPYLRIATLREKLSALGRAPVVLHSSVPSGRDIPPQQFLPRLSHRTLTWLPGKTPARQARSLLKLLSSVGKGR